MTIPILGIWDLSIETSPLTHGEHREFKRLMLKVFAETPWMGGL